VAQGEEIPVDIEPIASTSAVIIETPEMAQQGGAQIQGNIFGQQLQAQAQQQA
jgi:hypothetical protein